MGKYAIPRHTGTELFFSLFTSLELPLKIPALLQFVHKAYLALLLSLLKEEGLVVQTHSLLQLLLQLVTYHRETLTKPECDSILERVTYLADLPPILKNQFALQTSVQIMQTLLPQVALFLSLQRRTTSESFSRAPSPPTRRFATTPCCCFKPSFPPSPRSDWTRCFPPSSGRSGRSSGSVCLHSLFLTPWQSLL